MSPPHVFPDGLAHAWDIVSVYPPSRFGGWAKARFGGPSSVLPAPGLADRSLGAMYDSWQLRLARGRERPENLSPAGPATESPPPRLPQSTTSATAHSGCPPPHTTPTPCRSFAAAPPPDGREGSTRGVGHARHSLEHSLEAIRRSQKLIGPKSLFTPSQTHATCRPAELDIPTWRPHRPDWVRQTPRQWRIPLPWLQHRNLQANTAPEPSRWPTPAPADSFTSTSIDRSG